MLFDIVLKLGRRAVVPVQPFLQHMGQKIAGLFEGPGLGLAGEGFEVLKHGGGLQSASRPVNRDQALAAITMISTL